MLHLKRYRIGNRGRSYPDLIFTFLYSYFDLQTISTHNKIPNQNAETGFCCFIIHYCAA